MKKRTCLFILTVAVCCVMIVGNVNNGVAYAQTNEYGEMFYKYLKDFITANPKRECFTQGEANAADYLAFLLSNMGYSVKRQLLDEYNKNYIDTRANYAPANNIIGVKKNLSGSNKRVILGAHYDSDAVGTGSFDNGSGVAVLLTIADVIKDMNFNFDIEIAMFAAEEAGLLGSACYADSIIDTDSVLIYYNFDVCVGGENLYVYCEDINTPQLRYFGEIIDQCGADIETRVNMGTIYTQLLSDAMYTHIGMMSDNQSFKNREIPTVDFFSGSLDNKYGTYVENSDGSFVMHTERDNMSFFTNNENKVLKQADFLVKTVVNSLTKSDFEYKMNSAIVVKKEWQSGKYALIAFIILNVVAVVIVLLLNGKNKRDWTFGDIGAKEKDNIFEAPDDDDVFTFRE